MRTVICDRCNGVMKETSPGEMDDLSADMVIFTRRELVPKKLGPAAHLDLCNDCKESFKKWMGRDIFRTSPYKDPEEILRKRSDTKPKRSSTTKK